MNLMLRSWYEMPSNQYQEQNECFSMIDKFLTKQLPSEGVHIKELLRQALTRYAVSKSSILEFIKDCYVDTGYVINEDDILFRNKKVK